MPVRYTPTPVENVHSVRGIRLGVAAAKIKNWARNDVLLIECAPTTVAAAVFTQNRFCAAPVLVSREHLSAQQKAKLPLRAVIINAGNANAGTGNPGIADAKTTCEHIAGLIGCTAQEVLVCSTGVIMEPLPMARLLEGLPLAHHALSDDRAAWVNAAQAIMTTDTVYKLTSRKVVLGEETVTITGIAKGAGMIHPNMGTMLSFIACDAFVDHELWQSLISEVAEESFNRVTVDGDTSTNDTLIAMATGAASSSPLSSRNDPRFNGLKEALLSVAQHLAQAIARDGEGATKFITINVLGDDPSICKHVAFSIAHSPLVKTAFFASDPNLGRIICAIGNALPSTANPNHVSLSLNGVLIVEKGGRADAYREEDGQRVMKEEEITVQVHLSDKAKPAFHTTVWTCDFSHDYVTINADYRT
ncbi:MAG: bifunctional glutamate N-acetyltransferase/amino-acid acetyltransferase ArgJ [Burkholderiales bacterium]|nr:bifunctional glutamate N-acetyltransferase/amino-acid acetyltransferase ArgJ [Burkholderiales bacterium]